MEALVTGSTGFIGSHLVEALLSRGDDVSCLVRKTSNLHWIEKLDVHLIQGDYKDRISLHKAVEGMDYIFHLAAAIYAPDWETYFEANTLSTQNLIEACLEKAPEIKKFVFVSSISAAGPSEKGRRLSEKDECHPVSNYGRSKLQAEQIVLQYRDRIPVTILRPPNVIGPRQRELFESIKLIKKRIKPLMGKFEPRTSLCSVEDVVRATLLLAEREEAKGEVYFVTDSRSYSWGDITATIAEALGVRHFILKVPFGVQYIFAFCLETLSRLSGRVPLFTRESIMAARKHDWVYDGSKIERELGFRARFDMPETIKRTIAWYREQGLIK